MRVRKRTVAAAVGAVAAMLAAFATAGPALSATSTGTGCGTAAQGIINTAYDTTSETVYHGELASHEVTADLGHVEASTALASAVASGNVAKTLAATTHIVYTRGWHIVRLRALSLSGRVLADVGGPYILAPVTGPITNDGKVVGSFIMSVQDNVGYEKLVTRFTGLPIEFYRGGKPLMGRDFPTANVPERVPALGASITVDHIKSVAISYPVLAFPTGMFKVLLAIPAATAAMEQASCAEVNAETWGEISIHIAALIDVADDPDPFVMLDHEFDAQELSFVRQGSLQLASSGDQAGPASIPDSGDVSYDGASWLVYSFATKHDVRIYMLFPPLATGTTGPTGVTTGPTGASGTSGAS